MWAYFLANYAKFGYMLLGVLVVLKLMLTLFFQNYERSVIGVISAIFKWYGVVDRDLAENGAERFAMFLQNVFSLFLYAAAIILLFINLLFS